MDGTIFESDRVHIAFKVYPLSSHGEYTPVAGISINCVPGRRVGVRKVGGYGPRNYYAIQRARRAKELGIEVEVPEPIEHNWDYREEDMEDVIAQYDARRPGYVTTDVHTPEEAHFVKTASGVIQCWELYEACDGNTTSSWEDSVTAEVRALVPERIAAYCDRVSAFFKEEKARYWKERDDREREVLRKELGV